MKEQVILMMKATELKRWLGSISYDSFIAIDDGGFALVELDESGFEKSAYLEVCGTPETDD
ncbi:hypothetical protein E5A73_19570 [Sphingomonas gei]|uniref:Uncharacterized protein n=1 Tax=Sphingomonas gei TaxID=1395960 RepID=A0A4S1WZP1_9SPHN|nr:hypothetical protein [Sphingomonas gei]TGX49048.1 hypothetical protein E5A73_19570 [Sphingomonas gei]